MSVASLLTAATISACGVGPAGAARDGRLHVVATVAPTCPVERVGEPPCVAPYTGKLDILDSRGRHIAEVTTTAAGIADVTLPPGSYSITAPTRASGLPRLSSPVTVTVTASVTVTAPVQFDTGIR